MRRWNAYWFPPSPLVDLAVARIVIVGFQLGWMLSGALRRALETAALRADDEFQPLLVVRILGLGFRPSFETLDHLHDLALALGSLALIGLATPVSLALFTGSVLYLQAFAYSFGRFHHNEALLAAALLALACSPAGGALSLDRLVRRRVRREPLRDTSPFAAWPLLLVQWLLSLVWLSAAGSKLARSGVEWMNGYTLQYCAFIKGAKLETPLGVWLSSHHGLCVVVSWLLILFEATFFLVLVDRRFAQVYVPLAVAVLVSIDLTIGASFYQLVALLVVFVPWSELIRGRALPA